MSVVAAPLLPLDQAPRAPAGLLRKRWPVYVILASFLTITLPFSVYTLFDPEFLNDYKWSIIGYLWLLGYTHFVITLVVYLPGANLRHFNSSWRNRILYFFIPPFILIGFDLFESLGIPAALPMAGFIIMVGIRLFDFYHFNRQSYGVLQLFKGRAKSPFPTWLKQVENAYFLTLTALLAITYLRGGSFDPNGWPDGVRHCALGLLIVAGALLAVVVFVFGRTWTQMSDRTALVVPACYFVAQSTAAGFAIYSLSLYVFSLAIHYVEYHVLMFPRCFDTPLDMKYPTDRWYQRLRRGKVLLYVVVILLAGWVAYRTWNGMSATISYAEHTGTPLYLILIAVFDGLFIVHYFLEALIWRFSEPYYRKSLGPLYFG